MSKFFEKHAINLNYSLQGILLVFILELLTKWQMDYPTLAFLIMTAYGGLKLFGEEE